MHTPSNVLLVLSGAIVLSACQGSGGSGDPDPALDPVLNQANYVDVVAGVFDVFRGAVYDADALAAIAYPQSNEPVSTEYEYVDTDVLYRSVSTYACDNDGGVVATSEYFYDSPSESHVTVAFSDCGWNGGVYTGGVKWYAPLPHGFGTGTLFLGSLGIDGPAVRAVSIDGQIDNDIPRGSEVHVGDMHFWGATLSRYEQQVDAELAAETATATAVTLVTDVETHFAYGRGRTNEPSAELDGVFSLQSPRTGNRRIDVSVPEVLRNGVSTDRYFRTGTLLIDAEDGSQLRLDAVVEEPAAVRVSLTIDGVTQVFDERWDTWYPNLTFEFVDDR